MIISCHLYRIQHFIGFALLATHAQCRKRKKEEVTHGKFLFPLRSCHISLHY